MKHLPLGAPPWTLRLLLAGAVLAASFPAAARTAPAAPANSTGAPPASSVAPAPSEAPSALAPPAETAPVLHKTAKEAAAEAALEQQTPEEAVQSGVGLVNRAHASLHALDDIRARANVGPELDRLHDEILQQRDALRARVQEAQQDVRRSRRAFLLRDIRFSFLEDRRRLDSWQKQVAAENERLTAGQKRTRELLDFWQRAQELARQSDAPEAIRQQADRVVDAARATELALDRPMAVIIPLQSTLTETREMLDSFLQSTRGEGPKLIEDGHLNDFTIWTAVGGLGEARNVGSVASRTLSHMLDMGRRFLTSARAELLAQNLFTLLAFLGMRALRDRAKSWREDEPEGSVARRIMGHPFASALQIGTMLALFLYREFPTVVGIVLYLIAISSGMVLFLPLLGPRLRRLLYITGAFVSVDLVRIIVADLAYVERLLLIGELAVFALLLARSLRRDDWKELQLPEGWRGVLRFVVWVWLLGAGVGTLAGAAGYGYVADILGAGMLRSMYLALVYAGLAVASTSILWVVTGTGPARRLHFINQHRTLVIQRLSTLFIWIAVVFWVRRTLAYLTLYRDVAKAFGQVLGTPLEVGALSISLGNVLALVLGTILAVYLARLVRFVLEQDLLGRLSMSEGSREVASSGIYWAVALIGFFTALAAAGIGLEKLTVLAGAVGVGVGFGLQNVVQNFVGGLILLFGRFIKVGDKIQLADLHGEVRAIGFRASTVRTWQGAEVIVPNSKLISDQVINWTLSDQKRRIELNIGVAYGTDPERVIALLSEVGRSHEKVLNDPPVVAFFMNHGDSSLLFQLRAWVLFDDSVSVSSELTVALNKRLIAEGIEIPFPQRDLHLRTIAPEAAESLGARPNPSS